MIHEISLTVSKELGFADRLSTAGTVTLQGMLTIFLVLALLWGTIEIMHLAVHRKGGKKTKKQAEKPAKAQAFVAATPASPTPVSVASTSDDALVAVITAAICAMRAEQGATGGFRVVSFQRRGNTFTRKH